MVTTEVLVGVSDVEIEELTAKSSEQLRQYVIGKDHLRTLHWNDKLQGKHLVDDFGREVSDWTEKNNQAAKEKKGGSRTFYFNSNFSPKDVKEESKPSPSCRLRRLPRAKSTSALTWIFTGIPFIGCSPDLLMRIPWLHMSSSIITPESKASFILFLILKQK